MAWEYKREESQFAEIPEGKYRVVIDNVEKKVSRNGNDMLEIRMSVSGQSSSIWYYISFLEDRPKITNRMLTRLFDSFGIEEGNFNLQSYVGKAGAAMIKHDDDTGRAKISYLIAKSKQDDLPPFVDKNGKPPLQSDKDGFMVMPEISDDDIPF